MVIGANLSLSVEKIEVVLTKIKADSDDFGGVKRAIGITLEISKLECEKRELAARVGLGR